MRKPTKAKIEAEILKKKGQQAVTCLEKISNPVTLGQCPSSQLAKMKYIAKNEQRKKFLPKKAKKILQETICQC